MITIVRSFDALVAARFAEGVNAVCWERALEGDFAELAAAIPPGADIVPLDEEMLGGLRLSDAGRAAARAMLEDARRLHARGLDPLIELVRRYERDDPARAVPTDVHSFHVDRAPIATDTYLCTYSGAPSEGLRNDEARRRVDAPATRAALLREFGGPDGARFHAWLRENAFDLHYEPLAHARPWSFGVGHLWRIAVQYPGSPVPACIHRAPESTTPRLLLIS